MTAFRAILYPLVGLPVLLLLFWYFVLPEKYIQEAIEDAVSEHTRSHMEISLNGFRKGILFTLYADELGITIDGIPAINIAGVTGRINPLYFLKNRAAFSIEGNLGGGTAKGHFLLPGEGSVQIRGADLNSISYLASAGFVGSGTISGDLTLQGNSIDVTFEIPDTEINNVVSGILLPIRSFDMIRGALSIQESTITIRSIGLEAEKGYARLKGDITDGYMDLSLEIMPSAGKLESYEKMLLTRYRVSPGHYLVPIRGPVRNRT